MSAEDLEIHQAADTPQKEQWFPLKGSLADGLSSRLQRGEGVLRGGSLPSLLDVLSHPNEEEDIDSSSVDDIPASNHKEQEKTFI